MHMQGLALTSTLALVIATAAAAQDIAFQEGDISIGGRQYSPYLYQSFPDRVFFGDTHLHTSYSTDAGMIGNRLGPDAALRFAKGEQVIASTGCKRDASDEALRQSQERAYTSPIWYMPAG